jgi:hypothetical protein
MEAVSQNEQDVLLKPPLIDCLGVAVTRTAVDDTTTFQLAGTLLPTVPIIMEAKFTKNQKVLGGRDLPAWNRTNVAPGGGTTQNTNQDPSTGCYIAVLTGPAAAGKNPRHLPTPAQCIKKPRKQWEGTIDLLLHLILGVTAEAHLPPLWHAWSNCNKKKEARLCSKSTYETTCIH